jgi:low temperature requirement protein LtrA
VSAAFDGPIVYWLWAVALASQVIGWVIGMHRWTPPETQQGGAIITTTPSLIERMGLFVIIVLGEVIVGGVSGMADLDPLDTHGIVVGLLGVVVAIGLWWIYFDLVSHRPPVPRRTQLWLNLHFPLVVAIAAGGAAVLNTIEHEAGALPDALRWLLAPIAVGVVVWLKHTEPDAIDLA